MTVSVIKYLLVAMFCLAMTWIGQSFVAANQLNDSDSSYFVYGGQHLLQGGRLYEGFWDQKPPGIFWVNALLIRCFGLDFTVYAIVGGVLLLFTLWHVFLEFRRWMDVNVSLILVACLAYAFNLNNYVDFGNRPEYYMCILDIWSLLVLLRFLDTGKAQLLLVCGFLSACAALFKPVGMSCFLAGMAYLAFELLRSRQSSICRHAMILLVGFSMPLLATSSWFAWQGLFREFFDASILVPLQLKGETISLGSAAHWMFLKFGPLWGLAWPVLLWPVVIWFKLDYKKRAVAMVLGLHLMASLSGILLQRKGFPHYFLQGVGPLLITASFCFYQVMLAMRWRRPVLAMIFLYILAFSCTGIWSAQRQWRTFRELDAYAAKNEVYRDLARHLEDQLGRNQTFYYLANGYQPYILSGRQAPYRCSPYILKWGEAGAKWFLDDLKSLQSALSPASPDLIVEKCSDKLSIIGGMEKWGPLQRDAWQHYQNWLHEKYLLVDAHFLDQFALYKRRDHKDR